MFNYKIEERDEYLYFGYTWQCDLNTDLLSLWNEFYTKELKYQKNPFVVKTLPDDEGNFTYSICIQGYNANDDLSKYNAVKMPKSQYARIIFTESKESIKSINRNVWDFIFAHFNLASAQHIELYGDENEQSETRLVNIIVPIAGEKTKWERAKNSIQKYWSRPDIIGVISAISVATIGALVVLGREQSADDISIGSEEVFNENLDSLSNYLEEASEIGKGATRKSPEEHDVKPHGQHYNTKDGRVWKEKKGYRRKGGSDV